MKSTGEEEEGGGRENFFLVQHYYTHTLLVLVVHIDMYHHWEDTRADHTCVCVCGCVCGLLMIKIDYYIAFIKLNNNAYHHHVDIKKGDVGCVEKRRREKKSTHIYGDICGLLSLSPVSLFIFLIMSNQQANGMLLFCLVLGSKS